MWLTLAFERSAMSFPMLLWWWFMAPDSSTSISSVFDGCSKWMLERDGRDSKPYLGGISPVIASTVLIINLCVCVNLSDAFDQSLNCCSYQCVNEIRVHHSSVKDTLDGQTKFFFLAHTHNIYISVLPEGFLMCFYNCLMKLNAWGELADASLVLQLCIWFIQILIAIWCIFMETTEGNSCMLLCMNFFFYIYFGCACVDGKNIYTFFFWYTLVIAIVVLCFVVFYISVSWCFFFVCPFRVYVFDWFPLQSFSVQLAMDNSIAHINLPQLYCM